jgi:superfamily II DNA or RNA helicase
VQIRFHGVCSLLKFMGDLQLSDILLAKLAGWEVVKQARALLAAGRVLSSEWQPPNLRGAVQEGSTTYRAGLVIRSASDADNLCTCRDARQRGLICAHSVAAGLHFLKGPAPEHAQKETVPPPPPKAPVLRRALPGQPGEPLELFLILPPNFAVAAARGKIMLYVEGKGRKGRSPLDALPLDTPFALDDRDAALLDTLEEINHGGQPAMLLLESRLLTEILPRLVGHPRVTLGKSQPVEIINQPPVLPVRAHLEAGGEILLSFAGEKPDCVIAGPTPWIFTGQKLQPLGLAAGLADLAHGPVRIQRVRVPAFLNLDWPKLAEQGAVEADFALEDFELEPAAPEFKLHLVGGLAVLQAELACFYGGVSAASLPPETPWLPDPQSPTRYAMRNFAAEQAAAARLLRAGFIGPDARGCYHLNGQNPVLNFFARDFPHLEQEWKVTLEERLERSAEKLERVQPRFQITSSGEQWFDLHVSYDTPGGEPLAPAEIQRLLLSGQSHTRLKNGKFALLDTGAVEELQEVLTDCAPRQHASGYRLDNVQAGYLQAALRQQNGWKIQAPAGWLQGDIPLQPPPLGDLEAVLRPYQKEGAGWLLFLRNHGFGGILADEMGLGKTVQVLAHLRAVKQSGVERAGPALVVCPSSLVFNWEAEAAKFTPDLRVLALHGAERSGLFAEISSYDLIVTSYALLRRDAAHYRGLEFDTVVLDEAQHIKNRQTQNAQAVKAVRARYKLVLTGTPVENSVLDLWSIFDFLMPGYLGAEEDFRQRCEIPIMRERNAAVQARLARRLRPFVLRRRKREVAADLPEKIEQVSFCELNPEQRAVYQQVLEAGRREVVDSVNTRGLAGSRMIVLTALLRLRQVCCDLRLLKTGRVADVSGKVELFHELLEEALDGGHRALVFSQFTSMLSLLRQELEARNIGFCYLDGATTDRARVVDQFQRDAAVPVFLISLKAGGVGLNLTGADTVIHFDPWWNPAVEAQATDRAHRLGQKKVVTSYKLITRGTVEEKILSLQTRKRALTQGLLGGEETLAEAVSWEDIRELLEI